MITSIDKSLKTICVRVALELMTGAAIITVPVKRRIEHGLLPWGFLARSLSCNLLREVTRVLTFRLLCMNELKGLASRQLQFWQIVGQIIGRLFPIVVLVFEGMHKSGTEELFAALAGVFPNSGFHAADADGVDRFVAHDDSPWWLM
jgi:hypothetical protein